VECHSQLIIHDDVIPDNAKVATNAGPAMLDPRRKHLKTYLRKRLNKQKVTSESGKNLMLKGYNRTN